MARRSIAGSVHRVSRRLVYVVLAAATIGLGLWVHLSGIALRPATRDVLGDALWAAMIVWWISTATPDARLILRSAAALAICVGVELSQLIHVPAIDAVRTTTFGHLVLGSGFDTRDLAAYALGVCAAAVLDWATLGRVGPS